MKNFLPIFVAHCESCTQDIKIVVLEIKVSMSFLREREKKKKEKTLLLHSVFFLENSEILTTPWM